MATSWQVKKKYNDKVYKSISVRLPKQLVEHWEVAISKEGISKAGFIRREIEKYLES